jgi:hypothetical protein
LKTQTLFLRAQLLGSRPDDLDVLVELQMNSFKECSGAAIAVPFLNPVAKRVGTTIRLRMATPGQVVDPLQLKLVGTTIVDPLQSRFVKKLIGLSTSVMSEK